MQVEKMEFDERPWGNYLVLEENPHYKVKKITVYPQKRLSLQRHKRRQEHWYIIAGKAEVTLEEQKIILAKNQAIDIALGELHRIENIGNENLQFIEVQTGDYFGEDDIERLEDDFGRIK